ncbi:extensin-like isoform X2 [Penaeus japonicus]|uniref:extensin-like isoform X2 n=1 Tax=Penaeus japonicus TaxID=27405 RepID=UPI001C71312E|nr:extensin-like isoform X2 [Penaeus japonicus]
MTGGRPSLPRSRCREGGRYKCQVAGVPHSTPIPPQAQTSFKRAVMKGLCVVALVAALCVAPFRAERPPSGVLRPMPRPGTEGVHTLPALLPDHLRSSHRQTRPSYRPDVPSFQRPQIQPRHPSFNVQTKPLPRPVGAITLPAELPEDFRQTRPFVRPDVPSFQRPQIQPRHPSFNVQTKPLPRPVGAITLPAELPEDFRQTRPFVRPDVPSFQRPQIQPRHPSFNVQTKPLPRPVGVRTLPAELPEDFRQTRPALRPTSYVPHAESEICQSCERLTFVRRGACCKRWNLCC